MCYKITSCLLIFVFFINKKLCHKKSFENIIKFIELTLYLNNLLRLYNINTFIFKLFKIKNIIFNSYDYY